MGTRTNFKMEYDNITMTRGDTVAFNCFVYGSDGAPIELDAVYFTCKERVSGEEIFQLSYDHGIVQDSDELIIVRIAPEDTKDVPVGIYFYDFQIVLGDDVFTVQKGTLTIEWDATY